MANSTSPAQAQRLPKLLQAHEDIQSKLDEYGQLLAQYLCLPPLARLQPVIPSFVVPKRRWPNLRTRAHEVLGISVDQLAALGFDEHEDAIDSLQTEIGNVRNRFLARIDQCKDDISLPLRLRQKFLEVHGDLERFFELSLGYFGVTIEAGYNGTYKTHRWHEALIKELQREKLPLIKGHLGDSLVEVLHEWRKLRHEIKNTRGTEAAMLKIHMDQSHRLGGHVILVRRHIEAFIAALHEQRQAECVGRATEIVIPAASSHPSVSLTASRTKGISAKSNAPSAPVAGPNSSASKCSSRPLKKLPVSKDSIARRNCSNLHTPAATALAQQLSTFSGPPMAPVPGFNGQDGKLQEPCETTLATMQKYTSIMFSSTLDFASVNFRQLLRSTYKNVLSRDTAEKRASIRARAEVGSADSGVSATSSSPQWYWMGTWTARSNQDGTMRIDILGDSQGSAHLHIKTDLPEGALALAIRHSIIHSADDDACEQVLALILEFNTRIVKYMTPMRRTSKGEHQAPSSDLSRMTVSVEHTQHRDIATVPAVCCGASSSGTFWRGDKSQETLSIKERLQLGRYMCPEWSPAENGVTQAVHPIPMPTSAQPEIQDLSDTIRTLLSRAEFNDGTSSEASQFAREKINEGLVISVEGRSCRVNGRSDLHALSGHLSKPLSRYDAYVMLLTFASETQRQKWSGNQPPDSLNDADSVSLHARTICSKAPLARYEDDWA